MDSVLIIGNGLTLDTYGNAFSTVESVNASVPFYKTEETLFEDELFSAIAYPELVVYIEQHDKEFYEFGKYFLESSSIKTKTRLRRISYTKKIYKSKPPKWHTS